MKVENKTVRTVRLLMYLLKRLFFIRTPRKTESYARGEFKNRRLFGVSLEIGFHLFTFLATRKKELSRSYSDLTVGGELLKIKQP